MGQRRSGSSSLLRFSLAMAALTAFMASPSSATDSLGSCNEATPGWACAKADDWLPDHYCDAGQSGGCETCEHSGNPNDSCFYGGGAPHYGWVVGSH